MKVVVSAVAFSKNTELVNFLLQHFPDAIINDQGKRYSGKELVAYYKSADAIITGLEKIDSELLDNLPNLRFISKYGVGLDNIDIDACKKRNIQIGWTGGINKNSVAELTLAYMLMLSRNIFVTANQLKNDVWNKSGGFSLSNKTIGIIGLGHIGKELIRLLEPFNCRILANDLIDIEEFCLENNIECVSKDYLYKNADIITLHVPLDSSTQDLINEKTINLMKSSVYIINTSRGGIVNEDDLKNALRDFRIGGAALDVFKIEPPVDKELINFPNLIPTPHIAGNSYDAVVKMGMESINHLLNFQTNKL